MTNDSKYTKWKVIGGYSLLFLLSILTTISIYKQITRLIVNEENTGNSSQKLFIIGNTITNLYEAEALSNAFVQTGSKNYFRKYRAIMERTEDNIDSLRNWTTRLDQLFRIDTISDLLEEKVRNLQDLVYVKNSFTPEEFYNKAITNIESGRDSLQEEINVRRRFVTTVDSSYIKSEKKRRWFLAKPKQDSILKVSTSHHMIVDTLDASLRNTDTVVNILRATWEDVQKQTKNVTRKINQKEYALIRQSTEITDQLKRILGDYEKEEIYHSQNKQQNREQAITTMIRIFAWVAVVAFLLVVFFTFFILRDLSRSQRYRRELEKANHYASDLLKSREKMILTVTHDIKSPLSSIIGYIELLHTTPVNERQRYFLKNMKGSSEHILKLIGNLLDLSKLENNKMSIEKVVFNPAQLFQEISDTFMPLAAAKQLTLNTQFHKDLNQDYKGDALRIRQIVTNILSNAIKYTTKGNVTFTATTSTGNNRIILKIQDTGSGMTLEEQKLIFQEFTRLKSHSAIEGTGLGLTITIKLVHLLQGEIKLQSKPGQGSCFTIILPLQQAETPIIHQAAKSAIAITTQTTELKVLLVDDDPLQLEMTSGLLKNHGIHPTTTTHSKEVISKLQAAHYDLVFSDIQMPELNGFELVHQIRHLPDSFAQTIPVIALSADAGKNENDYLQAGFTAYLSKPFTSNQLMQLITRLTGVESTLSQTANISSRQTESHGYTLKNILQFTDNDQDALNKIIDSFITSTREHLIQLENFLKEKQYELITRLAHKMLPMFRQLEATNIVIRLEKLEHPEKFNITKENIPTQTQEVIQEITQLAEEISKQRST